MTRKNSTNSIEDSPSRSSNDDASKLQRLQRVMAAAGVAARRECELIILEGRVEVDGEVVSTLGVKVDPERQKIFVDGQRLTAERLQYFMLNKPPGIISTSNDPSGRARVIDLIKTDLRVYNVGRLDQSSEGLILVTNDGELANRLTHPRYGIEKKYHVQVDGVPTPEHLRSLVEGIYIDEGKAKATSAKILKKTEHKSWLEVVLSEGKNREIRRILAKIGHKVRVLKRVAIGPLKMGELPVGAHRQLTFQELKDLKRAAEGLAQKGKERRAPESRKKKFTPRGPRTQAKRRTGFSKDSESKFRPKEPDGKPKPGTILAYDSKSKGRKPAFPAKGPETGGKGKSQFSKTERFQRSPQTSPARETDDDAVSSKIERSIPFDQVRSGKARPEKDRLEQRTEKQSEKRKEARTERRPDARTDGRSEKRSDGRVDNRRESRSDRGPRGEQRNASEQGKRFRPKRNDARASESRGSQSPSRSDKKPTGRTSFGGKQVSQIRGSEPVKSRGQRPVDRNRANSKRRGGSPKGRQR